MKKINLFQYQKHLKHALKNAYVLSSETTTNPYDNDIKYNTLKLSNGITIKTTYMNKKRESVVIDKDNANDINCYFFHNDYILKA